MFGYPKQSCLHLPTPVSYLPNLSDRLGIEFYMKRDDLTEFGVGGNKLRKLEYLIYDAKEKGATMLITVGGAQTNHGRLTAAVAAKNQMKCAIIAMDDYPGILSSNMLLDRIFGAYVFLHKPDGTPLMDVVEQVAEKFESQGERCYFIPMAVPTKSAPLAIMNAPRNLNRNSNPAMSLFLSEAWALIWAFSAVFMIRT